MSYLNLPERLPLVRYRYTFRVDKALSLPEYAGSTLRGVFGHALLNLACTCSDKQQNGQHNELCLYRMLFEASNSTSLNKSQQRTPPPSYWFEVPLKGKCQYRVGEDYVFCLVLTGEARQFLSLITSALKQAFSRGVGGEQGRAHLVGVAIETDQGWQDVTSNLHFSAYDNSISLPQSYPKSVGVQLLTPMRIQHDGKIVRPEYLTADVFLRQLLRRVSAIAALYWYVPLTTKADYAALLSQIPDIRSQKQLDWYECSRYSNRQRRRIPLGGVIGYWYFDNLSPDWSTLLYLAQWLHIGKEIVFGHGACRLISNTQES